jgi:hypothetical protein
MWGALEPVGSRKGSNVRALVVPDYSDLGHLFKPVEPLISRAVRGSSGVLLSFRICRFRGLLAVSALEPLISNFCRSRAPVAPVYFERALRTLVGIRTLRGSVLFEPAARAARGSSLLGKGPGHLVPAVAAIAMRCGRAFSGVAAARVVGGVGRRT